MVTSGIATAGISWDVIGSLDLTLRPQQEGGQGDNGVYGQQWQSVPNLSMVACLMEALNKPATEVTGKVGKDLILCWTAVAAGMAGLARRWAQARRG